MALTKQDLEQITTIVTAAVSGATSPIMTNMGVLSANVNTLSASVDTLSGSLNALSNRVDKLEANMATKDDLRRVEARLEKKMATMIHENNKVILSFIDSKFEDHRAMHT